MGILFDSSENARANIVPDDFDIIPMEWSDEDQDPPLDLLEDCSLLLYTDQDNVFADLDGSVPMEDLDFETSPPRDDSQDTSTNGLSQSSGLIHSDREDNDQYVFSTILTSRYVTTLAKGTTCWRKD